MQLPNLYYYRDKDGREIDVLIIQDNFIYPIEIKKAATVQRDCLKPFTALSRHSKHIGNGGIICLYPEMLPLDAHHKIIPVGFI